MKRFNLINSVKSLMSNYSNKRGDQYFNIGMTTEFNSQLDHSNYQSLYLGYNLDMYDGQDEYPDIISCATGDLIGKLINKLDDHFGADYDINRVSSQITMVIVNKMRIVLTLVNSNLGLYITYLQN